MFTKVLYFNNALKHYLVLYPSMTSIYFYILLWFFGNGPSGDPGILRVLVQHRCDINLRVKDLAQLGYFDGQTLLMVAGKTRQSLGHRYETSIHVGGYRCTLKSKMQRCAIWKCMYDFNIERGASLVSKEGGGSWDTGWTLGRHHWIRSQWSKRDSFCSHAGSIAICASPKGFSSHGPCAWLFWGFICLYILHTRLMIISVQCFVQRGI